MSQASEQQNLPSTIDGVLDDLNQILSDAIVRRKRIGYFVALYLRVTWAVKRAILAGDVFQNNERMERLDVIFANRFLDAWRTWSAGGKPSRPWEIAFEALDRADLMVLQHLAVGMNAHINLDLGIAAEQVMRERGEPLADLETDFNMINQVLERLVGIAQVQLSELSHTFSNLERLAPRLQGKIFDVVLNGIRNEAWIFAEKLAAAENAAQREAVVRERASTSDGVAEIMLHPIGFQHFTAKIAEEESRNGIAFNVQVIAE